MASDVNVNLQATLTSACRRHQGLREGDLNEKSRSLGSLPIRILHWPVTPCSWVSKEGTRRYHFEVLSNKGFWEDNMIQDIWESSELFLPNSISIFFFTWNIVNLQCCVCFKYTAKWFSYTYIHIYMYGKESEKEYIHIYVYPFSDSFPL